MNSPTNNNDAIDPQAIEYLKQEAEHYYNAELQHEQRANWLMVTAIALTGFAGNKLIEEWTSLGCDVQTLFIAGMALLAISVMASIIAIWPLAGRQGRLAWPLSWRASSQLELPKNAMGAVVRHCEAHRRRAVVRARQVVWALIPFVLGLAAFFLGLALTVF